MHISCIPAWRGAGSVDAPTMGICLSTAASNSVHVIMTRTHWCEKDGEAFVTKGGGRSPLVPTSHLANVSIRCLARCGEIKAFVAARPNFCQHPWVCALVALKFHGRMLEKVVDGMEYYLAMLL